MKALRVLVAVCVVMAVFAIPTSAQPAPAQATITAPSSWGLGMGAGLGAAGTIIGAGYGISTIAGKAVESMARQPEVAGKVQTAMIISAALIEGVTFFALIVCLLQLIIK